MLTGLKNLDLIILNKLDDKDLVNMCRTNTKADELCNDQGFWLNRIMIKFPYLELDLLKQHKKGTWSEYYINDLIKITPDDIEKSLVDNRFDRFVVGVKQMEKNVSYKIFNELSDDDLMLFCNTNKESLAICRTQTFWLNRIIAKFPNITLDTLFREKNDRTWVKYYRDLSGR